MCNEFYPEDNYLKYLFILIPIFSAIRLAKFNVDTEQSKEFKGLATPASTILVLGLFMILKEMLSRQVLNM